MAKSTFWFFHDYEPTSDPKIQAMLGEFNAEGYGFYWRIVEMLHSDDSHKLPMKPYIFLAIAKQMQANAEHVQVFIEKCITLYELFETDGNFFWSPRVNRNIGKRDEISEKRALAGKNGAIAKQKKAIAEQTVASSSKAEQTQARIGEDIIVENILDTNVSAVAAQPASPDSVENLKKEFLKAQPNLLTDTKENTETTKSFTVDFVKKNKPSFIEPYVLLWNVYAIENGKPKVAEITDKRKKKFKTRITEGKFDFIGILSHAKNSEFINTGSFFTFDWIIENQENYLKVLEGNYKNKTPVSSNVNGLMLKTHFNEQPLNLLS